MKAVGWVGAAVLVLAGIGWATDAGKPAAKVSSRDGTTVPYVAADVATPGQQVSDWWAGVQGDFQAVTDDQTAISDAAGNTDVAGVTAACGQMLIDVQTVQADPDAPDPLEQQYLAAAMDAYSSAASSCMAGDYTSATSSLDEGTGFVNQATARIKALTP